MRNRIAGFLSAIIFYFNSSFLLAEQFETQISADSITFERSEILNAEGNVRVQYGNRAIKAKALKFNQKTNEIKFIDLLNFKDGNAIELSAEEAVITSDLSEGIISAANILIDESIKIQSEEVKLKDGEIFVATGISRVTSCDECEGKEPKWYLSASSAKRDTDNLNVIYYDVTVRVKGLPIAYIPYLRMPDPSVDRARGFSPRTVLTSNLGSGLKIPYFIPMGISSDVLITPYFSHKTRTLEYRYRKKFQNGGFAVNGLFQMMIW